MKLKITVERAVSLPAADANGKSDPYVKFHWKGQKHKTDIKKKTLSPYWGECFLIDYDRTADNGEILFEVFDWDMFGSNDALGTVKIDISLLYLGGPPIGGAYQLQTVAGVTNSGMGLLYLKIQVVDGDPRTEGFPLAAGQQQQQQQQQQQSVPPPRNAKPRDVNRQEIVDINTAQRVPQPQQQHQQPPSAPGWSHTDMQPAIPPMPHLQPAWSDPVVALQQVLPQMPVERIQAALQRFNGDREQALNWLLENQLDTPTATPQQVISGGANWHYSGQASSPVASNYQNFSTQTPDSDVAPLAATQTVAAQVETDASVVLQGAGRKKALLVGINYRGSQAELRGCIRDVEKMKKALVGIYGFPDMPEAIVTLRDDSRDPRYLPTRRNMIYGMKWLVKDAAPGDCFFFHYSGHGVQVRNTDGTEDDGYDEVIMPMDFKTAGVIKDDELHSLLVQPLPSCVRLTAVMDCCHSGSGMDLPFIWDGRFWEEEYSPYYSQGDVQLFSGCMDTQTSADVGGGNNIFALLSGAGGAGEAGGAMTTAFLSAIAANPFGHTYPTLLEHIRRGLRARGLSQIPQLSATQKFPIDRPFNLVDVIPNHNARLGRSGVVNKKRKMAARANRWKSMLMSEGNGMGSLDGGAVVGMLAGAVLQQIFAK